GFSGSDEDAYDAESLYTLLERAVVPEFYDRPDDWIARMCSAIATAPDFPAQRMVAPYAAEVYNLYACPRPLCFLAHSSPLSPACPASWRPEVSHYGYCNGAVPLSRGP